MPSLAALEMMAGGNYSAVHESLHVLACVRHPIKRLPRGLIPDYFFKLNLENNPDPNLRACCKVWQNHDIEAWYTSENWKNKLDPFGNPDPSGGVPDVYKIYCTECGSTHVRFMVGKGDVRPVWEIR